MENNKCTEYINFCNQSYKQINTLLNNMNQLAYVSENELYKLTEMVKHIKEKEKEMYANMDLNEMQEALFHKVIFESLYSSVDIAVKAFYERNKIWYENIHTLPKMN